MTVNGTTSLPYTQKASTGNAAAGNTAINGTVTGNFALGDFWAMLFSNINVQNGTSLKATTTLLQTKITAAGEGDIADPALTLKPGKKTKMDDLSGLLPILPAHIQQTSVKAGDTELLPDQTALMATDETIAAEQAMDEKSLFFTAEISTPGAEKISAETSKNQKKFLDILDSLLNGTPLKSSTEVADSNPVKNEISFTNKVVTQDAADKNVQVITIDTANAAETSASLIAAGLSPEQITKLMKQISDNTGEGDAELPVITKILIPQEKKEIVFIPRSLLLAQAMATKETEISVEASAADDIASKLNNLLVGDSKAEDFTLPETEIMMGKEKNPASNAAALTMNMAKALGQNNKAQATPALSTFFGNSSALPDGLYFTSSLSGQIYPDGTTWSQDGATRLSPMTLGGPGMAASLVNTAQNAGASHPAAQVIAATLGKASGDGINKNITIRLEPPELGRVEVKLEFSKDKTMKAHMLVEKPETFLMLQRDAHVLERALQDSGLNSGNMSFELAQDGGQFDHGNGRHGGHGSSDGNNAEQEIEIIESTMTWNVDDAGNTHYDILA